MRGEGIKGENLVEPTMLLPKALREMSPTV